MTVCDHFAIRDASDDFQNVMPVSLPTSFLPTSNHLPLTFKTLTGFGHMGKAKDEDDDTEILKNTERTALNEDEVDDAEAAVEFHSSASPPFHPSPDPQIQVEQPGKDETSLTSSLLNNDAYQNDSDVHWRL